MSEQKHLWDYEHPYYCNQGNYFSNDTISTYETWTDFYEDENNRDMDIDMNLIFRWDWDDERGLMFFIIGQRHGVFRSVWIKHPEKEKESEIRTYLQQHFDRMLENWAPFLKGID